MLTFYFDSVFKAENVPLEKLSFFNWESDNPYRPKTVFRLAFLPDGLIVMMETDESDLRAVNTAVNSPCWEDSCMEFFFAPFGKENGYVNIEVNPNSAYLAQFGKERDGRVFLNTLTSIEPKVGSTVLSDGWKTEIAVPYSLIEKAFGRPFDPLECDFYAGFFKCGDLTAHPHWASFTPMGENPPGFHDPQRFEKIEIKRYG